MRALSTSIAIIALLPTTIEADTVETFRVNIDFSTTQPSEHGQATRSTKTTGCHKIGDVLPISSGGLRLEIRMNALNDREIEFIIELLDDQGEVARSTSVSVADESSARFDLSGDDVKAAGQINRYGPKCIPELTLSPDSSDF